MRKTLTASVLIALTLLVAGCNTMRGFGQDVQKAGEKIEDTAKKK